MADVRSLLKSERNARRIQHQHASYTATGTLFCTLCHLQLKSETLWDRHVKSPGHILQARKLHEGNGKIGEVSNGDGNKKKRKADSDEEDAGTIHKRSKAAKGLPVGLFDPGTKEAPEISIPPTEIQIPSRPATPSKPIEEILIRPGADLEDEWAAFEADIAATEAAENTYVDTVISAPAMSVADLAAKEKEDEHKQRRERQEAELEGDKEDVARKLEDEFDEMESLEQRVRKLREKREALRMQKAALEPTIPAIPVGPKQDGPEEEEEDEEDDDDDEDGWGDMR
jgi:zinc finger protein 830